MFEMSGNTVELYRYKITYEKDGKEAVVYCSSDERKNTVEQMLSGKGIEFTIEPVDQSGNEWINGLKFESRDAAMEVFKRGEEAYLKEQLQHELSDNLRLRADIDYLAIMSGVEM